MDNELFAMLSSMDDTPTSREEYLRSPIPYPGSKSRSLDKLLPHLPYSDIWVDAFGGSGSVTLARRKCKLEVFNDRHAGVVSFYRCLRDPILTEKLIERLDLTVHSREEFIWSIETWQHDELDDVQRAARWYYTIQYSFGAVGRNFGRSKVAKGILSGKIRDKLQYFEPIHQRFKNVQVENLDWRLMLKDYDSIDTVFYLDPPYLKTHINAKYDMPESDHIELCTRIFDCRGYVVLSGYDNALYNRFPWDRKESWPAHISVSTKAIAQPVKSSAEECIWIKETY